MPFGHEGRDWSDTLTTHETPKMTSKPPEARREVWNRFSLVPSEGAIPGNTLILDF